MSIFVDEHVQTLAQRAYYSFENLKLIKRVAIQKDEQGVTRAKTIYDEFKASRRTNTSADEPVEITDTDEIRIQLNQLNQQIGMDKNRAQLLRDNLEHKIFELQAALFKESKKKKVLEDQLKQLSQRYDLLLSKLKVKDEKILQQDKTLQDLKFEQSQMHHNCTSKTEYDKSQTSAQRQKNKATAKQKVLEQRQKNDFELADNLQKSQSMFEIMSFYFEKQCQMLEGCVKRKLRLFDKRMKSMTVILNTIVRQSKLGFYFRQEVWREKKEMIKKLIVAGPSAYELDLANLQEEENSDDSRHEWREKFDTDIIGVEELAVPTSADRDTTKPEADSKKDRQKYVDAKIVHVETVEEQEAALTKLLT